ncbi:hypothetical protein JQX13_17270 [Archangium violaceum]|uniref:hypothetical protein n=1 Tax=Archangium violaceum TaxID=83451 RepID=UPI00193B49B1|nr:hypothetical protein [Archangium violaceum]QRK11660.1 hypothetical protein JQX13_17270 [Archangium violaceum]
MEPRFYAFDPRPTRRALFVGACALAVLSAWALADARAAGNTPLAMARAGVTGGLMLAFVFAWHRLRPRPGWGITLSARGVQLARPFTGSQLQLSWGQIESVRRLGGKGELLGIFLDEGGRVLVTRHLFPSRAVFGELASALEERKPAPRYDA